MNPIVVNSNAQALPYLQAQPFIIEGEDGKTKTVNLVGFEMLKTDQPGEILFDIFMFLPNTFTVNA